MKLAVRKRVQRADGMGEALTMMEGDVLCSCDGDRDGGIEG